eukprot:scaffold47390_cov18-Tisochrysis_lutea.AAC.1
MKMGAVRGRLKGSSLSSRAPQRKACKSCGPNTSRASSSNASSSRCVFTCNHLPAIIKSTCNYPPAIHLLSSNASSSRCVHLRETCSVTRNFRVCREGVPRVEWLRWCSEVGGESISAERVLRWVPFHGPTRMWMCMPCSNLEGQYIPRILLKRILKQLCVFTSKLEQTHTPA